MNENQVRNLVEQILVRSQFGSQKVSFHTGNGVDSPRSSFIFLQDAPRTYSGSSGKTVIVNPAETGLIFGASASTYGGKVNSDGTAGSPFPTGWTSSDLGSSYYEITHNLGITNYSVALTIYASVGFIILGAGDVAANTFRVRTFDTSSASSDRAFYFLLTVTS